MSCKIRFWDRVQYKARRTHLLLRNGQESKSVWLELPTLSLTDDFLFFIADSTDGIAIRDSSRNSSSEDSLLLTSSSSLGTSPVIKRKSHSESTFKVKFHHSLPLFCCIHLFACILVDKTFYMELNIWLQYLELARKRSCQANFTQEISHQDKTTDQHIV